MKHTPYDYQIKAYRDVIAAYSSGHRAVGVSIPTRGGKSLVALQIVEHFYAQGVWFVAHKDILFKQMSDELTENGIRHGIIAPGYPELRLNVQVISKDTLFNRIDRMLETDWKMPAVIIIDEAHMTMSPRYLDILAKLPNCKLLGLSATWIRLDRKPFNPPFTHLVEGPRIKSLQVKGKICEIDTLIVGRFDDTGLKKIGGDFSEKELEERCDKSFVIKDSVKHWVQHAKDRKTLVFCVSIKHATNVAEEFNQQGYKALALSSKDGKKVIYSALEDYYAGKFQILCSVDLFTMGFTVKDCGCVMQLRPTESLMLYMQAIGRGFMVAKGKPNLINLDCVNNFDRHGYPEEDRTWALDTPPPKDKGESKYKVCPDCQRPVLKLIMECPACHHIFEKRIVVRELDEVEGQMIRPSDRQKKQQLILAIARGAKTWFKARKIAEELGASEDLADEIWCDYLKNKRA